MTKTALELENRIHKLQQKDPATNRNIINKLQRQLNKITQQNDQCDFGHAFC